MRYLLTTDPGIEDIVSDELMEQCPEARPETSPGRLWVESDSPQVLLRLRTVHQVIEIRAEAETRNLEEIRAVLADVRIDELRTAVSFRVNSVCNSDLDTNRMQLQGAAGAALKRRYDTRVDLENYELEVRADLYGGHLAVGLPLHRASLGNRVRRGKALRSSLKPTIAAAMLRLSGAHRGVGCLIDPMCGAGVIPVEAATMNPALEVHASDWDPETVDTARATLRNHELDIAELRVFDARGLCAQDEPRYDFIVTDPPHGMRQAKRTRLSALYRSLLEAFERSIRTAGRIVLIVVKYRVFRAAVDRTGLHVVHERSIESGGVSLRIYVLQKPGSAGGSS